MRYSIMGIFVIFMLVGCSKKVGEFDASQMNGYKKIEKKENNDTIGGIDPNAMSADDNLNRMSESLNELDANKSLNGDNEGQTSLSSVYFGYNLYNIAEDNKPKLQTDVSYLRKHNYRRFSVEGNCDEIGSDEYNYALGLKRAQAVREWFIAEGWSDKNISIVSFGEDNPVCQESNEECWKRNRRVDIKVGQ